jgi:hypothetical protein
MHDDHSLDAAGCPRCQELTQRKRQGKKIRDVVYGELFAP